MFQLLVDWTNTLFQLLVDWTNTLFQLLVDAGAKTNLTDNSGLSCQAFTGATPAVNQALPMHKIFSDGYM